MADATKKIGVGEEKLSSPTHQIEPRTQHEATVWELDYLIRSSCPLISIDSPEEERVLSAALDLCDRKKPWTLIVWDAAAGLSQEYGNHPLPKQLKMDAMAVLDWFSAQEAGDDGRFLILLLKDFQPFLKNPIVVRQLRNLTEACRKTQKTILLLGIDTELPAELEKETTVIDWPLPEALHIRMKLEAVLKQVTARPDLAYFRTEYSDQEMQELIRAFQGLTLVEVELLCTYNLLTQTEMKPSIISVKKRDAIRKSGLLEWVDVTGDMDSVGGLAELKYWLESRKDAFTEEARAYGLPGNPKGLLILGVQGTGKSLSAKAIASYWRLPLLRLDLGRVFSGLVGSSEANLRAVLKVAESVSPACLWIDEIEKGLSGVGSSDRSDGGTTARVFGTILTWMQEKQHPVFLIATANDVSRLPPELLRKGRFDEIFFVDLPEPAERAQIWTIHLAKRGWDIAKFDMQRLVNVTKSYTGAEIEASVESAMYEAFADGRRPINTADLVDAIENTVPLAVMMAERISGLREWAALRARSASTPAKGKKRWSTVESEPSKDELVSDDEGEL